MKMLKNVITLGVLGMISPLKRLAKQEERFAFELILEVISAMDGMKMALGPLIKRCGLEEKKEQLYVEGVPLLILVLVVEAVDPKLILPFREVLINGIKQIEEQITGEATFFIEQAKWALEEENLETFQEAFNGAVKMLGADPEGLKKDLQRIENFTTTALGSLQSEQEMHAITGISQA